LPDLSQYLLFGQIFELAIKIQSQANKLLIPIDWESVATKPRVDL